ncbi:MAG: TetR/AcrR family transcriptional regulator [Pseudomonadota bacterium]
MTRSTELKRTRRRTQAERSEQMKQRLIEAAIECLDSIGYASLSVSQVVDRADVSRGAFVHQFATKAALMNAVGEHLVQQIYRAVGRIALTPEKPDERFGNLVHYMWRHVFDEREGRILLELLHAARTDPEFAEFLRPLALRTITLFHRAAEHYFSPSTGSPHDVSQVIYLVHWSLKGLALDRPLMRDRARVAQHVDSIVASFEPFLTPRDVVDPPPLPEQVKE